jgi:capsular exopolysaccharide synthesis family protein
MRSIIADANPLSPISEAYRKLRTNLKYSESEKALKVLMITSANAKEGKSTTAVNLAAVYAQAEQRVLLLDCDMRKPTVHQTFAVSNRSGLSQILSGQAEWHDAVQSTRIRNLQVLTSGPVPPNAASARRQRCANYGDAVRRCASRRQCPRGETERSDESA